MKFLYWSITCSGSSQYGTEIYCNLQCVLLRRTSLCVQYFIKWDDDGSKNMNPSNQFLPTVLLTCLWLGWMWVFFSLMCFSFYNPRFQQASAQKNKPRGLGNKLIPAVIKPLTVEFNGSRTCPVDALSFWNSYEYFLKTLKIRPNCSSHRSMQMKFQMGAVSPTVARMEKILE